VSPAVADPTMKRPYCPAPQAVARMASFDQNPLRGGMPERAAAAMKKTENVIFSLSFSPPISLMYFVPVRWMRNPAIRKRAALKMAWLISWNKPADSPSAKFVDRPARPSASIM
jgi:hypothetical protein